MAPPARICLWHCRIFGLSNTCKIGALSCTSRVRARCSSDSSDSSASFLRRRHACLSMGRNDWTSFEAAHIFPLSHEELFISLNYPQYISNWSPETDTGINSCQNGLSCSLFAIDPDENYRITCFSEDIFAVDGRTLDPLCRNPGDEQRVIDEFLRWHFRQAVLANMKGNGEPVFEADFPDGSDMMGEILSGPRAAERMEAELFSRLNRVSSIP
ncbi:hypothetical protein V1517DRAFT_354137 [Lipomyces orientalis]|uniref:Uncharacterized protein n=1 Tax=Lipomyces orientalis TaxID=1233043 RepID=A0ACC3TIB3_9ASCO